MQVDVNKSNPHFWFVGLWCTLGGLVLVAIAVISCWIRKCRISTAFRKGSVLNSINIFVLCCITTYGITINRYIMISHPRLYARIYRHKFLAIMIALTWIFPFSSLIRTWQREWGKFGLDQGIGSCSILPDSESRSPKEFVFVIAFALPCLCVILCYARKFYIVRKRAIRAQEPNFPKHNTSNNNLLQLKSGSKSASSKLNQSISDTQKESDSKDNNQSNLPPETNSLTNQ